MSSVTFICQECGGRYDHVADAAACSVKDKEEARRV